MIEKHKPKPNKIGGPRTVETPRFSSYVLDNLASYILIGLFFASATLIFFLLRSTLIPILTASRILISFGVVGFLLAYLFRKPLNISVLDGLYYNVFGISPIAMVCFLAINAQCSDTYLETYQVKTYDLHGNRYSFDLEDDAYAEFWRIRTIEIELRPARTAHIEFTFCNGIFGYKVVKSTRLF